MLKRIRQISLVAALIGLLFILRSLPIENGIELLTQWVDGKGVWGPMVFGLAYLTAALLFVPGSVLTLAAGAVFGLSMGTLVVSLSSTTAAALSFLIARHMARAKVEDMARGYPVFGAVDNAIGQAGWRMVALLRLSPLMPFSLGNYLYGLTAVPFWPYTLASWVAMLPGTFMYVYFGHVGTLAFAGGDASGGPAKTIMTIVGLLATVVVTVYVSKLANRAIKQQTDSDTVRETPSPRAKPWLEPGLLSTLTIVVVAAMLVAGAVWAHGNEGRLAGLFGPRAAKLSETYDSHRQGEVLDHAVIDRLLSSQVDDAGFVDYRPLTSIKDIPSSERWDAARWALAGTTVSLNQIEHELIRPNFAEPRIHFAPVCAAVGCPPLRSEAYTGDMLEEQLADQSRYVHAHARWFDYEAGAQEVGLTALYDWYGGDFEQVAGSAIEFAARYSPALLSSFADGSSPTITWLDYDWRLNSKENAQ